RRARRYEMYPMRTGEPDALGTPDDKLLLPAFIKEYAPLTLLLSRNFRVDRKEGGKAPVPTTYEGASTPGRG
ncbi:hypothetical protein HK405_009635, partial [Cladochytrium tenue]